MCNCDAANNWTLQCRPSPVNSSCLGMQCQGTDNLYIGNTTSTSCNRSTCAYAGYSNQAIITTLDTVSTCPVPDNSSLKLSLGGWNWNILLISVHLVLFCLHFLE
ncbi:hypothetical protein F0562_020935 [Nyssa sinensis]|uniref:Uncharacterized protein n=1 Tax=Nyssa sinensis TaxID=561372 RepID=A0A5J5BY43_9ASTE|nr:hypothetical protein F0562_020935 [Nyssa sinensis]